MRGSEVRKSAKERLKGAFLSGVETLRFDCEGKKIIVANTAFYPNIAYSEVLY